MVAAKVPHLDIPSHSAGRLAPRVFQGFGASTEPHLNRSTKGMGDGHLAKSAATMTNAVTLRPAHAIRSCRRL